MNYTAFTGRQPGGIGCTLCIATSQDLVRWTKHGPAFLKHAPDKVKRSRSGVVVSRREGDRLIAAKIDGKYWMYYTFPCAIAWSENLIDWIPTGKAVWPGAGREAGAIALLRDDGILLMTQGGHRVLFGTVSYPWRINSFAFAARTSSMVLLGCHLTLLCPGRHLRRRRRV